MSNPEGEFLIECYDYLQTLDAKIAVNIQKSGSAIFSTQCVARIVIDDEIKRSNSYQLVNKYKNYKQNT